MSSLSLRSTSGLIDRRLRSLVSIADRFADIQTPHVLTDVVVLACLVVFIIKLKASLGQSRMTRLMRSIFQDGILYFLVMMGFHIMMLFFTITRKVIKFILFVEGHILTSSHPAFRSPSNYDHRVRVLPFRLSWWSTRTLQFDTHDFAFMVSVRKTVAASLVQVWDEDHLTAAESCVYEMMDFAGPLSSQPLFSPIHHQDSERSSALPDLLDHHWEA